MSGFVYAKPSDQVTPTWSLTSANSSYPASNASDFSDASIPKPALSTTTTDDLIGDFATATRVDWIVLQHNLDAGLTNVKVEMNATNSWGSPTVTTTLTIPAKRTNNYTTKILVDLTAVSGYSTGGFRYIRIHVGTANSVAVGFKVLCYSRKRQLSRNFKFGMREQRHQLGIELTTAFGATWHYATPSGVRTLVGMIEPSDSNYVDLIDWIEASEGVVTALGAIDPNFPREAFIVRVRSSGVAGLANANGPITTSIDTAIRPNTFRNYNPTAITLEEVSPGGPEWT